MTFDLITPITIGLIGSFHCIGMCGPIAVALPLKEHNWAAKIGGGLLYNFGRTITYAIMGLLFGLLGQGIHMVGFQQWASIILGIALIISVLFPYFFNKKLSFTNLVSGYSGRLVNNLRKFFNKRSYTSLSIIGLLNGLLPCGLVYVAIAGAISTGSVTHGALFMALFGLGTIPMMLVVSLTGHAISSGLRSKMRRVVPYFVFILGILFILRGMSLGIPYISPKAEKLEIHSGEVSDGSCCH